MTLDNFISTSDVVTITAVFSKQMTDTPTISISNVITNVALTQISGTNSHILGIHLQELSDGTYTATVSGSDLNGKQYIAGTQSLTL